MPKISSSMSDSILQWTGSPTCTGTICEPWSMIGRPKPLQPHLQDARLHLLRVAQRLVALQMPHRRRRPRRNRRGQRGGEDETGGIAAHRIHHLRAGRDIAAHHAIGLGQRAVDDVDPAHQPVALGHAAAARAVHAHGMNLVDIGQRAELLGQRRRSPRSGRNRHPSNRSIRRRSASAPPDRPPPAARADAPRRCAGRSASRRPPRRTPSIIEAWFSASE